MTPMPVLRHYPRILPGRRWDFSRPQPYDIWIGIAVAIAAMLLQHWSAAQIR
jgi:hypothetical protein